MPTLPTDQPQFLFDDAWIADSRRLVRRWLPAAVHPEPVVQADRPWEGAAVVLYGSVVPVPGGGWRLYYSNFNPGAAVQADGPRRTRSCLLLAESDDGLHWRKPALDLVPDVDGGPTNVVFCPGLHLDAPSVMTDPADSARPWKLISFGYPGGFDWQDERFGMHAYHSADGLHWQPLRADGKRVLRAGDRSAVLAERVGGEYWLYTRHPEMGKQTGGRAVYLSRSADFRDWTEPELVLRPDLGDEPGIEFYGMPVFRRHGWFFGLLEYWQSDTDTIEVHLAVSRDGHAWQRPCRRPFIGASYPWNRKWSSCASNGPIVLNEEMVFYFGGRMTSHHYSTSLVHGAIGRAALPLDRFCALEGLHHGGQFTTPLFTWPGGDLTLNADTRESFESHPMQCNGEIGVEVLEPSGTEWPEWCGPQRAVFRGNTHCRCRVDPGVVRWAGNRSLSGLAGRELRLRFHLRHARLYTFAAAASP
jgi:hypothetical protein